MKNTILNFENLFRVGGGLVLFLALSFQTFAQVPDPVFVKGCGTNGNGTYSINGTIISFQCPNCCSGYCTNGSGGNCHRCYVPTDSCGQNLLLSGLCNLCIEMRDGTSPYTSNPATQVIVYALNKFWWVSGITSGYSPGGDFFNISGTLEGPGSGDDWS